ncbi:hypothetical protein PIB30_076465 [Stylosanthes scabra]|uniref:RRM domain-containing protein n=1 Tax=Stylosanthes scabra TaxID=79078 RepID=A0ABU6SQF6_9FABA|nr:hypothetical protein [Stylosanthes scabra]
MRVRRERENTSGSEGDAKGQWRVVTRGKPYSHWRHGQKPTHYQVWDQRRSQALRGGKGNEGEKWIKDETFSVFVNNLTVDATKQWLWKAFSCTGKVEDVYLSRKVRKTNPLRFAFVRYKSIEEVRRTVEHLDSWIVWGCQLKLTEFRYRRDGKEREEDKKNKGTDGGKGGDE